jgi:hypothetical protein
MLFDAGTHDLTIAILMDKLAIYLWKILPKVGMYLGKVDRILADGAAALFRLLDGVFQALEFLGFGKV